MGLGQVRFVGLVLIMFVLLFSGAMAAGPVSAKPQGVCPCYEYGSSTGYSPYCNGYVTISWTITYDNGAYTWTWSSSTGGWASSCVIPPYDNGCSSSIDSGNDAWTGTTSGSGGPSSSPPDTTVGPVTYTQYYFRCTSGDVNPPLPESAQVSSTIVWS